MSRVLRPARHIISHFRDEATEKFDGHQMRFEGHGHQLG